MSQEDIPPTSPTPSQSSRLTSQSSTTIHSDSSSNDSNIASNISRNNISINNNEDDNNNNNESCNHRHKGKPEEGNDGTDESKIGPLTKPEKDTILMVLARDENIRRKEEERIRKLQREVRELRAKGLCQYSMDANTLCARCQQEFSWWFNKGQPCFKCQQKVCSKCRQNVAGGKFFCLICLKIMELEKMSGEWFYSDYARSKEKSSKEFNIALELLKATLNDRAVFKEKAEVQQEEGESEEEEKDPDDVDGPVSLKLTDKTYESKKEEDVMDSKSKQFMNARRANVVAVNFQDSLEREGSPSGSVKSSVVSSSYKSGRIDANNNHNEQTDHEGDHTGHNHTGHDHNGHNDPTSSDDSASEWAVGSHGGADKSLREELNDAIGEEKDHVPPLKKPKSNLKSALTGSFESLASVYSGAGEVHYGKVLVTGEIELSVTYEKYLKKVMVNVHQCKDLGKVNFKDNTSNPYVKIYLLPDKSRKSKRKTSVKKRTLNPVFNEIIEYILAENSSVSDRSLLVSVWHAEGFGRNDFLGEVVVNLVEERLEDLAEPSWFRLNNRKMQLSSKLNYYGHLDLSLKFVSKENLDLHVIKKSGRGELMALVKQARNLSTDKSEKLNNSYCQAVLFHGAKKSTKQKSEMVKQKEKKNLTWNHTFVFSDISRRELLDCSLEFTFWDKEKINSNDFLGGVRLNMGTGNVEGRKKVEWMDGRGDEVLLWQSMMDRPDSWVDGTLLLRANMASRKT